MANDRPYKNSVSFQREAPLWWIVQAIRKSRFEKNIHILFSFSGTASITEQEQTVENKEVLFSLDLFDTFWVKPKSNNIRLIQFSPLFFACPKESSKEKGTTNDANLPHDQTCHPQASGLPRHSWTANAPDFNDQLKN